nr:hypothetical protein [Tanacetum cinerariifolium]
MLPKLSQIVNWLYAFVYETNHSKSGLGLPSIVALVMVIDDKSWTLLERHERSFYIGLEKFADHCKPLVNSAEKIRCPCKSCQTILWVSIKHLSDHIMRHGFDLALLNDLSYIPPNNEHNDLTQGDIGETSNKQTQARCNGFEELYASANEELYPGFDYVTRLDFMAKFTYFKVKGNKDLDFCLVYNTSRWKDSNTPRKKVPKKVLRYFFIIPRLQRLYKSSHTAKEMIWHATGKCTDPGKMQHPVDGRAWKKFDTMYPDFAKEPRNVRLGLAADGFNPLGNLSQAYSMWLVILTTYNLPPWLCMKENSFMLTLLIPGPKSPRKNIDVYLRPLIEDLKQYLPDKITKPIIELCSFFKQICSATLMEDDVLKAQIKVVDNLYDLELIYPHALFNIMIHLVIHLPLEALEGGPIRPRWMFPFERYIKKLKGYVRNKAKLEGSIAEGYVTEEALTFSSHYFQDVIMKFNRHDCNSFIRFDAQELKKVKWYVLHNSPKIDTYRSQFKSLFPSKDMKEEFPNWFGSHIRQRHVDNDKDPKVSTTSELFALACRLAWTPISINSCVVDGVRYVVHSRDEHRTTQNSGICSPGPDREMYYEEDPDIIHFDNSSDLLLSTSLNDLDNATLHIDGQSMEVDAPPDIIDVHDEDDDIIDDEDALPHDLADFGDEDLINVDDNGVDKMLVDVARSHDGDGGVGDRPLPHMYIPVARVASLTESSYIGKVIKGVPLYYPSWLKVLKERKAALITDIETQFDLRPHMESPDWTEIDIGIQQHLQKAYNTNKAAFKAQHWVIDPETGTYNVEKIRWARPKSITVEERDKQSSTTQEYSSLIDTFFVAHTVNLVFTRDEDCLIYFESAGASGSGESGGCRDDEESADDQEDEDEDGDGDS